MAKPVLVSLHVTSGGAIPGGRTLVRFGLLARTREKRAALRILLSVLRLEGKEAHPFRLPAVGVPRPREEGVLCLAEAALPGGRYRVDVPGGRRLLFEVPGKAGGAVAVFCAHAIRNPSRIERFAAYAPHGEILAVAARQQTGRCCRRAALRTPRIRPNSGTLAVLYDASPLRRERFVGGKDLAIRRGEYAVVGPAHRTLLSPRQPFPARVSVVRIGRTILRSVRELLGLADEADPFGFDAAPRRMTPALREALNQVARAAAAPRAPGHHLAVTAACQSLLLFLVREHPGRLTRDVGAAAPTPRSPEERLRRAMAHVQEHFAGPCRLREIAAAAGVSSTRLITLFKERLQTTPHDHLRSVRVERATILLADRSRTLASVAETVGYAGPRSLRRAFKARTGRPIRAFRVW